MTNRGYEDAAILTFHNETDSVITFAEGGTGQLADALHNAMRIITMFEYHSSN